MAVMCFNHIKPDKIFSVQVIQGLRNSLWIAFGGKSLYFYEESKMLLD